jgi:hypothetical protein
MYIYIFLLFIIIPKPEDDPLIVETYSVDFKSINKNIIALMAEHVKGLNIMLVVIHATGCKQ